MIVNCLGVGGLTCPSFQSPQKKLRKSQVALVDGPFVVENTKTVAIKKTRFVLLKRKKLANKTKKINQIGSDLFSYVGDEPSSNYKTSKGKPE